MRTSDGEARTEELERRLQSLSEDREQALTAAEGLERQVARLTEVLRQQALRASEVSSRLLDVARGVVPGVDDLVDPQVAGARGSKSSLSVRLRMKRHRCISDSSLRHLPAQTDISSRASEFLPW